MPSMCCNPWDNSGEKEELGQIFRDDSDLILPNISNINDGQVLFFHDFLERLIEHKGLCKDELGDIKGSDTIETLYKRLNYRIAQCRKFKEEALKLTKELVNNYIIISRYKDEVRTELDDIRKKDIHFKVYNDIVDTSEQICIGYIYRIVLDIRRQSFFHIYFNPIIYTDTKGRSANLQEEEIRNVSFEEISTSYKIITKDEYERKIKELFIKDITNDRN